MNPELLSANLSLVFMAAAGGALLANVIRATRGQRLLPMVDATAAAGLLYLFGTSAFGWGFLPREALFAVYAAIFSLLAAMAILRRTGQRDAGAPLGAALIQQAALAYIFSPDGHWKQALSALLAIYFFIAAVNWLRGSEPESPVRDDPRPPLFPPKRIRGLREFAGAGLAAALVYVFAMGTGRLPVPTSPEPAAQEETSSEAAAPEQAAEVDEAAKVEEAPAAAKSYKASAGETLKSIARKLYGKGDKWRALAAANPGLKPGAKLKAGQTINLPIMDKSR
jgi:phage tail protein X